MTSSNKEYPADCLEVCFNFWPIVDEQTALITAYAGKAYTLRGGTDEKLRVLQALATEDHHTAIHYELPDRFITVSPDGSEIRATSLNVMNGSESFFWVELIETLTNELPLQIRKFAGQKIETPLPIHEQALSVVTPLIQSLVGVLKPITESQES